MHLQVEFTKKVNYRKCFKAYYSDLPRIASFIGTSNEKSLLTDETGSRRFLCIEVEKPIDCSPIDYVQLYAQLKFELESGKRYWLTKEEEQEIQEHNQNFYKQSTEEEVFFNVFRLPNEGEAFVKMTASSIFNHLQKRYPTLMRGANVRQFGKVLCHIGAKKSRTNLGSVYEVIPVGRSVKPDAEVETTQLKQVG